MNLVPPRGSLSTVTRFAASLCLVATISLAFTASAFSAGLDLNKLQALANDIEKVVNVDQPAPKKNLVPPDTRNGIFAPLQLP